MDLFVSASTSSSEEEWTRNFADAFGVTSARPEEAAPEINADVAKFEADIAAFDIDDNNNVKVKDYVCANDDNDDIIMRAKGTKNGGGECEEDVFLSGSSSGSSVDDILFDEHSLMFACEEES